MTQGRKDTPAATPGAEFCAQQTGEGELAGKTYYLHLQPAC
jgi:hypothetical protein